MADLALDLTKNSATYGDLMLVNGDLILTSDANPLGTNAVVQDVTQRLRTFQGEWFMDTTAGLPWIQKIFAKGVDQATVDQIIQAAVLAVPGVLQLSRYSSTANQASRFLTVQFTLLTTSGAINYSFDGSSLLT